jgi:hydroxypyruvate isomerase
MRLPQLSRRTLVKSGFAATALGTLPKVFQAEENMTTRKNRIKQSVCKWCYPKMSTDELCAAAAKMGMAAIDLLNPDEYEVPKRYGLVCSMGYVDAGTIPDAMNRLEHHADIEAALRKNIPLAARAGVPSVITFSGNRHGMDHEQGARNTIIGLNRVKKIAEDNGVHLCLELLNSKVNHPDYMADHTAWGVRVMQEVNSPNIKLLYDIYHMQIMEGDVIATIGANMAWIGHFHTGGVPGRHELDNTQELQWDGIMRAIAASDYKGYVAHEFIPLRDPMTSLREAVDLCDV